MSSEIPSAQQAMNENALRHTLARRATMASVFVALILIMTKTWAYWSTGSVSLLGSLLDSLLDGVTSLINFLALRAALQPADDDHRFGHGKLESIAALAQSAFMIGSASVLVLNSFDAMLAQRALENNEVGVGVSVLAIVLTLGLVSYQSYVMKKSQSLIVEADSLHYKGDLMMNAAVIAALLIADLGWFWFDGAMAILIGVYLLYSAWQVGKRAFEELMDQHVPELDERVQEIVSQSPGTEGCHDVRCRRSGPHIFIQFHLELDENLSLWSAHEIGDRIEKSIMAEYPMAEVIIHHDPVKVVS